MTGVRGMYCMFPVLYQSSQATRRRWLFLTTAWTVPTSTTPRCVPSTQLVSFFLTCAYMYVFRRDNTHDVHMYSTFSNVKGLGLGSFLFFVTNALECFLSLPDFLRSYMHRWKLNTIHVFVYWVSVNKWLMHLGLRHSYSPFNNNNRWDRQV